MKTKKNLMLFVGLLTILVLSACATQATTVTTEAPDLAETKETETMEPVETEENEPAETETEEVKTVEASVTKDLSDLTDAEMEALIAEKAHDQHTLEFILSKDMSAEEWSATLDRMIGYGAQISPEEKAAIIEWLVNR
jgi:chorismate mutase